MGAQRWLCGGILFMFVTGALCLGNVKDAVAVEGTVPVMHTFAGKIVYTTDAAFDQRVLEADCEKRGGRFNTCGSVCDDALEGVTCVTVCAYTCEFGASQKSAAEKYNELRGACRGDSCCLHSVDSMEERHAFRRGRDEPCPEGYDSNMLRCGQSYQWCQPMEEPKK